MLTEPYADPQSRLLHNRSANLRVFGGAFIKALNWKIMTLWSVETSVSFWRQYVGYIDTVRHARNYKVKYVVATSAFFLFSCVKRWS